MLRPGVPVAFAHVCVLAALALIPAACRSELLDLRGRDGGAPTTTDGEVRASDDLTADGRSLRLTGFQPLRRLTNREYDNTVRDLLGVTTSPARGFAADDRAGLFASNTTISVSAALAQQYADAAATLANEVDLGRILACQPGGDGIDACARQFVTEFGLKAFRRPLTAEEVNRYRAIYERPEAGDFQAATRLVIQAMLQSPFFLYHVEVGEARDDATEASVKRLNSYELASRLSYLVWQSLPDDELFRLAASGQLASTAAIDAQVDRMIEDRRVYGTMSSFYEQWLGIDQLLSASKDQMTFPNFPRLRSLLLRETRRYMNAVIWGDDGKLATVLAGDFTIVDPELAAFYGFKQPITSDATTVSLAGSNRRGVLTQGAFLAATSHQMTTSPVLRGKYVREELLCQTVPPPPKDALIPEVMPKDGESTGDAFRDHVKSGACQGCHLKMDPIGFGFEQFDAIGQFRTSQGGKPIDGKGELNFTRDVDGLFTGAAGLAERLAKSEEVRDCVATQWFRFILGRHEQDEDRASLEALRADFAATDGQIRSLIKAVTHTDSFRYLAR